jgi:hypothetical protein
MRVLMLVIYSKSVDEVLKGIADLDGGDEDEETESIDVAD